MSAAPLESKPGMSRAASAETVAALSQPGTIEGIRDRASRYLSRFVFGSLLALIALAAIPYGAVEAWWEALLKAALWGLAGVWVIEGLLSGRWFVKEQRLMLPLIGLGVYAFWQSLAFGTRGAVSFDPFETRLAAEWFLALALAGALLLRYTTNQRRLKALVWLILGVAVASALFGLLRQTAHRGEEGFLLPFLQANSGYAQFINKNHFAFLAEMGLGLALGVIAGGGALRQRWLIYLAASFPLWVAIVLSGSRGGVVALLCQALFLAALAPSVWPRRPGERAPWWANRMLRAALALVLLAAMLVGVAWMGGEQLATRMEAARTELTIVESARRDGASRAEIWAATWLMIKDRPLLGAGFGAYRTALPHYHNASGAMAPEQAHNDYLELVASGGILGLGIALWFLYYLWAVARESLRAPAPWRRAATLGALAGICGVAVHSLFDFGLHIPANALLFIALTVVATASVGRAGEGDSAGGLPKNPPPLNGEIR